MEGEYYHTKDSVKEYIQLAKDVNGRELILRLQEHLPSGAALLELGSGPGTDWRILRGHFKVTGSDYSEEFLEHLKSANPDGQFLHLDATTLATDQEFDGIYSNKVLHHLRDEELTASIRRHAELLNPDGIICHSFWRGEGSEIFKGMFVNYHDEASLRREFGSLFDVVLLERYAEFEADDSILLIARLKSS